MADPTPLAPIKNHVEEGTGLLLDQFKGKPRIEAWLRSYLTQVQVFTDAVYDTIIKRLIDNAANAQLDAVGRIVGEDRKGRDDDLYRLFIRARIRINRSSGKTKDILDVLNIIAGKTPAIFAEHFPAGISITFLEPPEHNVVHLFAMLFDTKAGGVHLNVTAPTGDPAKQFLYCSVGDANEPDHAYGDVASPADFGLLSDALSIR